MILGSDEIKKRLNNGEIFRPGTFKESNVKEASYALGVADDGLILEGIAHEKGKKHPGPYLEIAPGKIALLSTQEEFNMPGDLVGRLGIRLGFAALGLTGLMGIQVDPYYGRDYEDERLYIRVANFGNDPVRLRPGDLVFNIEFSEVQEAQPPEEPKQRTWDRLLDLIKNQTNASWTYVTRVEEDSSKYQERFAEDVKNVREGLQPVVMFGVFLVAVTILGVVVALVLGLQDVPQAKVPVWVTDIGWIIILAIMGIAASATAAMGFIGALLFLNQIKKN